jgi:dihydrofolate reductase
MPTVRVNAFTISLDGYGAGPDQHLDNPLGEGGEGLHQWLLPTRTFQQMYGKGAGTTGVDNDYAARSMENIGAWIMGRNMFTHERGPWVDASWRGWWGENPPYHVPVFVLTYHPRTSLEMAGGTVFHFVTGGIEEALARATAAAGPRDIRVGGGVSTVRQFLRARLIDEMHLAVSPVLLGAGEHLLSGINLLQLGYQIGEHTSSEKATHVVITRHG